MYTPPLPPYHSLNNNGNSETPEQICLLKTAFVNIHHCQSSPACWYVLPVFSFCALMMSSSPHLNVWLKSGSKLVHPPNLTIFYKFTRFIVCIVILNLLAAIIIINDGQTLLIELLKRMAELECGLTHKVSWMVNMNTQSTHEGGERLLLSLFHVILLLDKKGCPISGKF